jgi:enoyl-CoA hydratase/carnithine racemase
LARLVGKSKAIELMAAGELFDFEKGETLGLVNRIIDATDGADFLKQVMEYAREFTTPKKASRAVGRIKRAVQSGAELPLESGLALERELQQLLFQSEDAKEGLDAYVNKRKANFKGK